MFSRVFRRNTTTTVVEDETNDNPAPQVQGSSNESTEAQPSGSKRKGDNLESESSAAPPTKYQRFELDSEEDLNAWDLLPELASYVNRYMSTHKTDKEIKDKILASVPLPNSVKKSQKLDEYMHELLQENRRTRTLSFEKTLKGIQDKVVFILAPFTRLMTIMEEEREHIPAEEQGEGSAVNEVSRLFDKTICLIGQVFHSIGYQRRLNILSALIDNNNKVKEILKEESLRLDDVENVYLFGERFEERLAKITNAKQKSKALFTGLQKKPAVPYLSTNGNNNDYYQQQPFRQSPLPQNHQRGRGRGIFFSRGGKSQRGKNFFLSDNSTESGNFECKKLSTSTSHSEEFDFSIEPFGISCRRTPSVFSSELGEANKRSLYFEHSSGISNSILIRTNPDCSSISDTHELRTTTVSRSRSAGNAEEGGNKIDISFSETVSKPNIFSSKKGFRAETSTEFEKVEPEHSLFSLQDGGTFSTEGTTSKERFHVQGGPQGCLFFGSFKPRGTEIHKV